MPMIVANEFSFANNVTISAAPSCVFIDQNHDVSMKGLRAKTLCFKYNRLLRAESYSQRDELPFLRWDLS